MVAISAASLDPMLLAFGLSASLSTFRIPESEILAKLQAILESNPTLWDKLVALRAATQQTGQIAQEIGSNALTH